MDELLHALWEDNEEEINKQATKLFTLRDGRPDVGQMNEFEHYAHCRVFLVKDNTHVSFMGGIQYRKKTYMFG